MQRCSRRPSGLLVPPAPRVERARHCDLVGMDDMMAAGGDVSDAYRPYVDLLIQPTLADSGVVDRSPAVQTITGYGSPTLSTTSPWAGQKSIAFNGSGQYVTVPLTGGAGAWCFELVFTITSGTNTCLCGTNQVNVPDGFNHHGGVGAANFQKTTGPSFNMGSWSPALNTPCYVAAVRDDAGAWYFFQNGARVATIAWSGGSMGAPGPTTFHLARTTDPGNGQFAGLLHACRITSHSRGFTGTTIPNVIADGPFPTI